MQTDNNQLKIDNGEDLIANSSFTLRRRSFTAGLVGGLLGSFLGDQENAFALNNNALYEPVPTVEYEANGKLEKIDIRKTRSKSDIKLYSHLSVLSMAHDLVLTEPFSINDGSINFKFKRGPAGNLQNSEISIASFINKYTYNNPLQYQVQLLASAILAAVKGSDEYSPAPNDFLKLMDTLYVKKEFTEIAKKLVNCIAMKASVPLNRRDAFSINAIIELEQTIMRDVAAASSGQGRIVAKVAEFCTSINGSATALRNDKFVAHIHETFVEFATYQVGWKKMGTFVDEQSNLARYEFKLDPKNDIRLYALGAAIKALLSDDGLPMVSIVMPKDTKNGSPSYLIKYKEGSYIQVSLKHLLGMQEIDNLPPVIANNEKNDIDVMYGNKIGANLTHAVIASLGFREMASKKTATTKVDGVKIISDLNALKDVVILKDVGTYGNNNPKPCISMSAWNGYF